MSRGSLVDRGANGGIAGNDCRVMFEHSQTVDVTGIDNHELTGMRIVDASAKVLSNKGYIIVILRQYAYHGSGRTIHASCQLEYNKHIVDDRSIYAGGRQCIRLFDGYVLPLNIIQGLPYI